MALAFEKIEACGNDFILLEEDPGLEAVSELCLRNYGLGANGVLVYTGDDLIHYDPDGSRSFCLNGARAALACLHQKGLAPQQGALHTEGVDLAYSIENERVRVRLPKREVAPLTVGGPPTAGWFVDVGNPQFVLVDALSASAFRQRAVDLRHDPLFRDGANVNLVRRESEGDVWRISTFERGVEGFTPACGSGMYASALVLFDQFDVTHVVFQPDGRGSVTVTAAPDGLFFEGDTRRVASGVWLC